MNSLSKTQQKHALVLLVREILTQLDELAQLRKANQKGNVSQLVFRETTSVLKLFEPELLEEYYDTLISMSTGKETPPRTREVHEDYLESVAHSRRRVIRRIVDKLGLEAA